MEKIPILSFFSPYQAIDAVKLAPVFNFPD